MTTRMGKHMLNVIEHMSLRDGYRYGQDMTAIVGKTADGAKEAQLAFKEKRAPVPMPNRSGCLEMRFSMA